MHAHVFVAGTFDGLHAGHIALLTQAFSEGENVTIGLTSDEFVRKYKAGLEQKKHHTVPQIIHPKPSTLYPKPYSIASYQARRKTVEEWLKERNLIERATVIPIGDPHEPLASMPDVDALIVTQENRNVGVKINTIRLSRGLPQLALIEVGMVDAIDRIPISSTRIRNGQINRDGKLIMPELLRAVLGKPMGRLISGTEIFGHIRTQKGRMIVTVGDMTTKTFLDAGVVPQVMIIDRLVGRNRYHEAEQALARFESISVSLVSGPGYIAKEAMYAIERIFSGLFGSKPRVIIVDGEEDLLVLPVLMYAPVGWFIYYGQPPLRPADRDYEGQANQGIVEVEVTDEKKSETKKLLGQFV